MIRASHLLFLIALAGVAAPLFASTCGQRCEKLVDDVDAKILLAVFIGVLVFVIFLQIYFTFFLVSALRVTRSCILFCKIGLAASVTVPWTLYVTGRLSASAELKLLATFSDAGYSSVFSLAISILALYFFNERHIYLSRPGNRRWAEID